LLGATPSFVHSVHEMAQRPSKTSFPYFADRDVTIYHADCRELLRTLPPESVDMVLIDPPYGVGYRGRWCSDWEAISADASGTSNRGEVRAVRAELGGARTGGHRIKKCDAQPASRSRPSRGNSAYRARGPAGKRTCQRRTSPRPRTRTRQAPFPAAIRSAAHIGRAYTASPQSRRHFPSVEHLCVNHSLSFHPVVRQRAQDKPEIPSTPKMWALLSPIERTWRQPKGQPTPTTARYEMDVA
jgi:hypothetical protein